MKHIGILAHSAEGSALTYLTACHDGIRRLGPHMHPDITLSVMAMGLSLDAWARSDLPLIRSIFADTADRLAAAGCDFFVCPDNTAHIALEIDATPLALPGLHIADVVVDEAHTRGYRVIGVLGTKWTMEGPVYVDGLARRGLELRLPPPEDMRVIDQVIFDELCNGVFTDASRAEYVRIIGDLGREGCEAVALACTEIPLLITPEVSPLPTLDSTRLLAVAAVEVALGIRPMPSWKGGPVGRRDRAAEAV